MFKSILSSIKTIITDNDQSKIKKAKKNLISEVTTFVDTLSTELKEGTKVVQEGAKEVYHEAKREFAKQEVTREVMKTINEYPTQTMQWIINTVYGHFELNSKRKYPKAYVHSIVQSIMKEEPKWNVETIVNEISKIKERFPFVDVETLTTVVGDQLREYKISKDYISRVVTKYMSLEKEEKEDWMKKAYPNSIRIEVKKDKKDLSGNQTFKINFVDSKVEKVNTEKVEDLRKILPARTSGRVILSKIKELLHKYPQLKNVETLADAVYVELKSEGKKISRSYIGRVINHYCDTLQKVAVNTGNIVKDFKDEVSKKSRPRKGSPIKTEILKRLQNIKTRCIITPTFAQEVSYSIHEAMISQGFEVSRAYIVKVVKEHLKK